MAEVAYQFENIIYSSCRYKKDKDNENIGHGIKCRLLRITSLKPRVTN